MILTFFIWVVYNHQVDGEQRGEEEAEVGRGAEEVRGTGKIDISSCHLSRGKGPGKSIGHAEADFPQTQGTH